MNILDALANAALVLAATLWLLNQMKPPHDDLPLPPGDLWQAPAGQKSDAYQFEFSPTHPTFADDCEEN